MSKKKWPLWWRFLWTVILGYCAVIEFWHFRREIAEGDYHNVPGPLVMGVGLLYMASESAQGTWP